MRAFTSRTAASIALGVSIAAVSFLSLRAQQSAPGDDRFYEAIRNDDLVALKALVADRGANARGSSGLSPLTMAAGFGSPAAVAMLVDAGAAVNPAVGLAPLHLAWRDPGITRFLLEHGANIEAKTSRDRTPLIQAAAATSVSTDVISQLLARGANVNAADRGGVTPLIAAAATGNTAVAKLLLEHGADANAISTDGPTNTALMGAATNSDAELTRLLLARKVDVAAISPNGSGRAKNGVVAFGRVTALHLAAAGRDPEVVRLLLDAGAPIDALDMRGMTPLMFAVATDNPEPRIVKLLVDRGAKLTIATPEGETAVEWARKYNNPTVLKVLNLEARPVSAMPLAAAHESRTPREAVERSLPLLRTGAARMLTDGGCTACHAQPMATLATSLATERGWNAEPLPDAMTQIKQHVSGALQGMLQFTAAGGAPEAELYDVFAMRVAGATANLPMDALIYYLAGTQTSAGNLHRPASPNRAPIQDGDMSRTALAINAFVHYATPARKAEIAARTARAAAWLDAQTPVSTEERVMQLLGVTWAGAPSSKQDARVKELLGLQQADGGWAQTPYLASDAYATGQVLYTLAELKVPVSSPAIQRGVAFLIRTQQDDGTWHVKTRAMPIQPYFQSGFPYEHDQWISCSGTAWADLGLASTAEPASAMRAGK
jgi:ankyrin repeat protein